MKSNELPARHPMFSLLTFLVVSLSVLVYSTVVEIPQLLKLKLITTDFVFKKTITLMFYIFVTTNFWFSRKYSSVLSARRQLIPSLEAELVCNSPPKKDKLFRVMFSISRFQFGVHKSWLWVTPNSDLFGSFFSAWISKVDIWGKVSHSHLVVRAVFLQSSPRLESL